MPFCDVQIGESVTVMRDLLYPTALLLSARVLVVRSRWIMVPRFCVGRPILLPWRAFALSLVLLHRLCAHGFDFRVPFQPSI